MRRRDGLLLALALTLLVFAACGDDDPSCPGNCGVDGAGFVVAPTGPTSVSDSLLFAVRIDGADVADARVEIRSDLDGVIAAGQSDAAGLFTALVPPLSRGVHAVGLWVGTGPSPALYDSVTVENILPVRPLLIDPVIIEEGVALFWYWNDDPEFVRYEVRRWVDDEDYDDSEIIETITEESTTDTVDLLPPLVQNAHYAVTVVVAGDLAAPSAPATVFQPAGPVLDFAPWDAARHPSASIIYLLDRDPNDSRLVAVDYLAKRIVADRTFTHAVQYFDVADNGLGVEVYISRSDDGISVLDPLTLADIVEVPMGYGTMSVAADGQGHVYVSIGTGAWSPPPLRSYDRATWNLLDEAGHYDWVRLECIPGRDELMEAGSNGQYHITTDGAGQFTAHEYLEGAPGAYQDETVLRIDPTGSYYVTHIWGSIYTADAAGTWLGNLPLPSGRYNDFAFTDDGADIFCSLSTATEIPVFNAANQARTGTVDLRGYSWWVFNDGTRLVSVSRPEMNVERVFVELAPLPVGGR